MESFKATPLCSPLSSLLLSTPLPTPRFANTFVFVKILLPTAAALGRGQPMGAFGAHSDREPKQHLKLVESPAQNHGCV